MEEKRIKEISNRIIIPFIVLFFLVISDISIILNIPIYRQVFGFILVTLIPGLLFTSLLNHRFNSPLKIVLYSVGMSIAFAMFFGFILNYIGPLCGFSRPLSMIPILFFLNIEIIILLIMSFLKNASSYVLPITAQEIFACLFSRQVSFLLLIVLLGIIGGFAVRYYIWSLFSVITMFMIATVAILIVFRKFFERKHYPIALFIIALTLLLNRTLTSPYLGGSDIHVELFIQKLTEMSAYWDINTSVSNVNTMLSSTILPTIYTVLLGIDTIVVYKLVFSGLFALVPVILYYFFKGKVNPEFSFFSVFLFMSFYAFFTVLMWLPRQQVAELFFALLLLTLFDKDIPPFPRSFFILIWISSIVVSHYALTYISLFLIILASILLYIVREKSTLFKLSTMVFAVIMTLSWYIYISLSTTLGTIVHIGQRISIAISDELFSPGAIDPNVDKALGIGLFDNPFLHVLGHLWQIGIQILIIIGLFYVISKYIRKRSHPEFTFISIAGVLFLFMSMTLPYFASSLNMDRIFHITLIFISPLCVIGLYFSIKRIFKIFKIRQPQKDKIISVCLVLVIVPYFLFNAGAIFEVTEKSNNLFLRQDYTTDSAQYLSNSTYFFLNQRVPTEDVYACNWISNSRTPKSIIYSDTSRECELWGYGLIPSQYVSRKYNPSISGGYVFIGRQNVIDNIFISPSESRVRTVEKHDFNEIRYYLFSRDMIYSNGAIIYN